MSIESGNIQSRSMAGPYTEHTDDALAALVPTKSSLLQQTSSRAGIYVYCVVAAHPFAEGSPPLRAQAIGGRGDAVRTVQFAELAAVVSDSPLARYDIGRQQMLAHQRVIEEAMTRSDVLPVRFGTVAKSDREVQDKLLRRKFAELQRQLEYVRDSVELGLKVFWNREWLFADIVAANEEIRTLRDALMGTVYRTYREETHYQRIQLGQLTEAAIARKRDEDAERILAELRPLALATKVNKTFMDMMILNAAFLVKKDQERAFDARVSALDRGEGTLAALVPTEAGHLTLKYVGPVPPYNFVNIAIRWED